MTLHMGWFSTGRDEAARNLLRTVYDDIARSGTDASIDWIFCHRAPGDGPENEEARQRGLFFDLARELAIPVKTVSHVKFLPELRKQGLAESPSAAEASPALEEWRNRFGEQVVRAACEEPADIVVMAGYMLIIGDPELRDLDIVNIHPALPWGPRGTWQEVIHQLIAEKAQDQGIMVHLVTKTLDRGPVISYCRFPIRGGGWDGLWNRWHQEIGFQSPRQMRESHPLFRKIRLEGEVRELPLLKGAIRELAAGAVQIKDKQIRTKDGPLSGGVDLTAHIEQIIAQSSE
ncbi:MAG: formyltransferase family protein [Thermodesulfobacteriota bacterium]